MATDHQDINEEAMRRALEEERDGLTTNSEATNESRAPVELDQQSVGRLSRMDALQGQAMANAQEARRQKRLRMIAAALQRMDEDEYGYCIGCGEPIPAKRLEIDPATPSCVVCAN